MAAGDRHEQRMAAPDELAVLAAVARAERHRTAPGDGVSRREVEAHLGLQRRSAAARAAATQLDRLAARGAVRRSRRHGLSVVSTTVRGRRLLERAAVRIELPESPQHSAWRHAREAAAGAIDRLRGEVRRDLNDAALLLDAREPVPADSWLELAERVAADTWRLGAATYCLYEWAEPDDARADVDRGVEKDDVERPAGERARRRRRAGRRNTTLWES